MVSAGSSDLSLRLDGRVSLVTGGARGIGAAIADTFAARGSTVAVVDLDESGALAKADELGATHLGLGCDVTDPASVRTVVERVVEEHGRIDVLVNSAGIVLLDAAESLPLDAFERTIAVNLTGTFVVCQEVGRQMIASGGGRIINLASQAATVALEGHVAYCASKFGVLGLSKVLASEWAGRGVTVNTISPTVVLTDLGRAAWAGPRGEALKAQIPTGRFAEPEEVAGTALYLASAASTMITGADLLLDGGYTIR